MGLMADFLAIAQNTAKLTNSVKRLNKEALNKSILDSFRASKIKPD